jgi:uncharacterized protein (DUF58 family)
MSSFFFFIIILFILAALLRVDFFFTILYLFLGVYIVLRLWSERVLRNVTIERTFINRAFIGDPIEVTLKIQNYSRLPVPWLMFNEAIHWGLSGASSLRHVISLVGKETQTFRYSLKAGRRGYYQVGPLIVNTGDLLGLKRNLVGRLEADYLIVYPKILSMSELGLPTHSPRVVLPIPLPIFEDPARITGIRPYRWRDNPRHIHWPASASSNQVMVKQFQPAIARESTIFINLNRYDYQRKQRDYALELAITVAASLANHMVTHEKLPVGLETIGLDPLVQKEQHFHLPPGKEQTHLMQILEVLARIQPIDEGDFLANIRQQAIRLSWGATIVIITNQESKSLVNTLLWLKQTGFSPSLVLVGQYTRPDLTARLNIPIFQVWNTKDIEAWLAVS